MIGSLTVLETTIVLTTELGEHNEDHLDSATNAFLQFGRGRHPAGLNFGDYMSNAVAEVAGMPLLFTGRDFALTDIMQA